MSTDVNTKDSTENPVQVRSPIAPIAPIADLVPHAGRMILLDGVLAADDESLSAQVAINQDSLFLQTDAASTQTGVPAWVGVEYMAQAVAAHAGYLARLRGAAVKVGFLLGTRRYHCSVPLFALGSVLTIRVQRELQGENGLGAFACTIVDAAGAQLANATLTVFQPENVDEFLQKIQT